MKEKKLPKKIIATIDATHAGVVNGNFFMYMPKGMEAGKDSFTKPYKKPVTDGHPSFYESEASSPVIGRIIDAEYVSYGIHDKMDLMGTRDDDVAAMAQEVYALQLKDSDFKGLGHMTVKAEITDEKSIKEILDGRKVTVSIGAFLDNARCSICGSKYSQCEHNVGEAYDGLTAFRIGGNMKFDHVAFVKRPADEHAQVSDIQITDNKDGSFTIMVHDEVLVTEFKEVKTLKQEIIDSFNSMLEGTEEKVIKKEIKDSHQSLSEKGKSHSYLFSDTKEVYIKDRIGLALAIKAVSSVEETEDNKAELSSFKDVIDAIVNTGKILTVDNISDNNLESIIDEMHEEVNIEVQDSTDSEAEEKKDEEVKDTTLVNLSVEAIDSIALAVYNKIKQDKDKDNSFSKDRLKTLELALVELEDKLQEAENGMLVFAKRVSADITDANEAKAYLLTTEKDDLIEDNKELEKLDLNDGILADTDRAEVIDETLVDKKESFNLGEVGDTYRALLREKGFREAKSYLKDLKEKNMIPDNFIL